MLCYLFQLQESVATDDLNGYAADLETAADDNVREKASFINHIKALILEIV